jgi:hypothetical protein
MVPSTALKLWLLCHLQCHDLPTEFHKYLRIGSEVDGGRNRHTDRMVVALAYILLQEGK